MKRLFYIKILLPIVSLLTFGVLLFTLYLGKEKTSQAENYAYVGLGDGINNDTTLYRYDPKSNNWPLSQKINFFGKIQGGSVAFVINNKIYIGIGIGKDGNPTQNFYCYDPTSKAWSEIKNFPGGKWGNASAFFINGKGYVGIGIDSNFQPTQDFTAIILNLIFGLKKQTFQERKDQMLLLFVVAADVANVHYAYTMLLRELEKHNPVLLAKKKILVISKSDLADEDQQKKIEKDLTSIDYVFISALTNHGIAFLKDKVWALLKK